MTLLLFMMTLGAASPAAAAHAQPAASKPAPADLAGPKISAQTFGGWTLRCAQPAVDGNAGAEVCELAQQVTVQQDGAAQTVMTVAVSRDAAGQHYATVLTALAVRIKPGLNLAVDQGAPEAFGYDLCGPRGCWVAHAPVETRVAAMKTGKVGRASVVLANGQPLSIEFPLAGFTAGLAALDASSPKPKTK